MAAMAEIGLATIRLCPTPYLRRKSALRRFALSDGISRKAVCIIRNLNPGVCRFAPHVQVGMDPGRVVERSGLDGHDARIGIELRIDRRPAAGAEVAPHSETTVSHVASSAPSSRPLGI